MTFTINQTSFNKIEEGKTYKIGGKKVRVTRKTGYVETLIRNASGKHVRHGVYQIEAEIV